MPDYWPDTIYVSEDAREDALTKRILERLPNATVFHVPWKGDPISENKVSLKKTKDAPAEKTRLDRGKRILQLKRYSGTWLKPCPGTNEHVCCNLWIVNPGEGCPLDCTYCYLQSYLKRNPTLKLFTNTQEMLKAIETKTQSEPGRLFRVGTGEVIDSLVWDELSDLSLELVPLFASLPNGVLELKTKADYVENLLSMRSIHQGKTVVSWSVNAKSVSQNDEAFTASLEERIEAAEKVCDAGYRVGFHFDPLIFFEGWEDEYRDTIQLIFSRIPVEKVAWVSVSSLRFQREMREIMLTRFPNSQIPLGEQFLAKDGKFRYFQPIRFRLQNFVWSELKSVSAKLPVYMCMESAAAWRKVAGGPPAAGSELVEIFSRKGRLSKAKAA